MTIITEQFEAQLMQAIVRQFFENPPIVGTNADGSYVNIQPRSTPAQVVAARLLTDKNGELLDAIMAALDLDELAEKVAAEVTKTLTTVTGPGYYGTEREARAQKAMRERVDARLVELLAQEMFTKMRAADADDEVEA